MRLALAFIVSLSIVAPVAAEAPPPAKRREAMHYPTLEKMLRRFAAQAGTASNGKIFASR
jgi:hypothetical protein